MNSIIVLIFSSVYRLIRPVGNSSDRLTVKMGLKLSQIIGVDMKRQIMITNVWVEQVRIKQRSRNEPFEESFYRLRKFTLSLRA